MSAIINQQFADLRGVLKVDGASATPELIWAREWAATTREHMVGEAEGREVCAIDGDTPATASAAVAI
jgi:hypothetical protein